MRFLGIDFGEKRIGVAISDEAGDFAYPLDVLKNDKYVIDKIKQICKKENVGKIVLGESLDFAGKCNDIMEETDFFKVRIEKGTGLPVVYENETMTTAEASRIQGFTDKIDASAAALILKGYLDKEKNKK